MKIDAPRWNLRNRSVAAVGDVEDVRCWSGIPFHFLQAARAAGFASLAWQLDLAQLRATRLRWNLGRLVTRKKFGGFQYSETFAKRACAQISRSLFQTEIITFSPHFPPAELVAGCGGELNHYLDATFAALTSNRGLDLQLPPDVVERGLEQERANYGTSRRIVTMARWSAASVCNDCGVDRSKVITILPGANLDFPPQSASSEQRKFARAGRERELVLGFLGMDWKRKGLQFLIDVRDNLARRGWKTSVLVAGHAPQHLANRKGVRFVGYIDKRRDQSRLFEFITACDVGCLFSRNEALGISTLEFLRAGVPVAGFAHQGLEDTLPPDAGFRFGLADTTEVVAERFDTYLRDEAQQYEFSRNARAWSPLLTWERCLGEIMQFWKSGSVAFPIQPWRGLPEATILGHVTPKCGNN